MNELSLFPLIIWTDDEPDPGGGTPSDPDPKPN